MSIWGGHDETLLDEIKECYKTIAEQRHTITVLKKQLESKTRRLDELSWIINPDKSGEQFTQEEIDRANEWR